jgi:tetratricopeptide (TPR) repeat protein
MTASTTLPLPPGIPATHSDKERQILTALKRTTAGEPRAQVLWDLAVFYHKEAGRSDLAILLLELIIRESDDSERSALAYLVLGHIAQTSDQWATALELYEHGLFLTPKRKETVYFLCNNAGYCLNALHMYDRGESYCRRAIEINSSEPYAFTNLGISLYAQQDFKGAAWCWVEAVKANPSQPYAAELLKQLLTKYPELKQQCPWTQELVVTRNAPKVM